LYGVQYSVDLGPITFIGIAAKMTVEGVSYSYEPASVGREWLEAEIATARAQGDWVMVGAHKLCISAGVKSCELGEELSNYLIESADVIVSGHEHSYERTYPLKCVVADSFDETCLAPDDTGTIWVINGSGGRNVTLKADDEEAGYFAALMGNNRRTEWGYGTSQFTVTGTEIVGTYVCGGDCTYTDSFTITR
jgi:hypothetical protein